MPTKKAASEGGSDQIVRAIARKSGVDPGDVAKVLEQLGLSRIFKQAQAAGGKALRAEDAKLAFRIGKNAIIH